MSPKSCIKSRVHDAKKSIQDLGSIELFNTRDRFEIKDRIPSIANVTDFALRNIGSIVNYNHEKATYQFCTFRSQVIRSR